MSDAFSDVAKITADWIDELAHYANSNDLCTDVSTILGRGQRIEIAARLRAAE